MVDVEIAEYLKSVRIKQKQSQKSVAEALNITAPQFNLYENGKRPVLVSMFFKWCEALGKKPHVVMATIYEREHPRSHISKKKRIEMLKKKPFEQLSDADLQFLRENAHEVE